MADVGVQMVRIGEFAWSSVEPEEDRFETAWLTDFVGQAATLGIGILMCTPSACPPLWLTRRYEDARVVKPDGRFHSPYTRKHYCPSSPSYRHLIAKVNSVVAAAVAPFDNIRAWQIDNELGPHECGRCFCDHCLEQFQQWLQRRYGTLDRLNAAWRTDYWSQRISDWKEIEMPVTRTEPSLGLDFCRFYHDTVVDFFDFQKESLRKAGVRQPISTNFMGPLYEGLDYWQFAQHVDVAYYDHYMATLNPTCISMGLDIYRNMRRDFFWLTETGPEAQSAGNDLATELRLWMYKTLARRARGRTCSSSGARCSRAASRPTPAFATIPTGRPRRRGKSPRAGGNWTRSARTSTAFPCPSARWPS